MIGRRAMRPFLRRIDRVVVSGERAAQAARYFGFKGSQIKLGFCGLDFGIFGPLLERRLKGPWPRKFLFVGRYAPEKALDVLVDAYARYRATAGADAWELVCCGTGPEGHRLKAPGIIDMGFVPPDRQAEVFTDAGAFVMASSYEPWGVAIAEGAASGLPLVCSDACGAVAEVLREGYNGYVFGTGDAAALARALTRVSMVDAPTWGARSRTLASAYDAAGWPQRVFDDLLPQA
jgi:glycosyltransferase involved in cell wall biosynthesis